MSAATIETPVAASLLPAVIEISARGQRQPAAQRVQHWPLTVGRAADADVALTEPCVAAHHLRVGPDDAGVLWVDVLDTINGVRHDGRHYPAGSRFAWNQKSPVSIGPVALEWRGADAPLPPEQREQFMDMLHTLVEGNNALSRAPSEPTERRVRRAAQ